MWSRPHDWTEARRSRANQAAALDTDGRDEVRADAGIGRNSVLDAPRAGPVTLDYGRMARVVAGVGRVVEELAR
jgi:hypothetical protein